MNRKGKHQLARKGTMNSTKQGEVRKQVKGVKVGLGLRKTGEKLPRPKKDIGKKE